VSLPYTSGPGFVPASREAQPSPPSWYSCRLHRETPDDELTKPTISPILSVLSVLLGALLRYRDGELMSAYVPVPAKLTADFRHRCRRCSYTRQSVAALMTRGVASRYGCSTAPVL
jgi:hypothetical protein